MSKRLGVIVWSPHLIYEGVDNVLDNLEQAGVTDIAAIAQVSEPAADASTGRREPPDDGSCGGGRMIDRTIWGKHEIFIHNEPSYQYDPRFYKGQRYTPNPGGRLTKEQGHIIGDFLSEAKKRGMGAYLQVQVCHVPEVDPNSSSAPKVSDATPLLPDGSVSKNRIYNFASIASDEVREYACSTLQDLYAAYPMIDGFVLDRSEQSFYTLDDAFLDFGNAARKKAVEYGFPFEDMRRKAQDIYSGIAAVDPAVLSAIKEPQDMSEFLGEQLRKNPLIAEILAFRAKLVETYLHELRQAADSANPGLKLISTVYPPPMSMLTGVDYSFMPRYVNGVHLKFFTMHWSMIVTCWAEQLMRMNPGFKESDAVRFVSLLFDFEDSTKETLRDYRYPEPDEAHIAGSGALVRKIREAEKEIRGSIPVYSFPHGYGPVDDVRRRFTVCWENSKDGMWVNRYGYLSDEKLRILSDLRKD